MEDEDNEDLVEKLETQCFINVEDPEEQQLSVKKFQRNRARSSIQTFS